MTHYGVIHGDPHLGNYALTEGAERLHLLDFGCVRIFPPRFLEGVVGLYRGLKAEDRDQIAHAYEIWGFKNLNAELIEALTLWARFIYGPLLDERVRTIADDVPAAEYGRREAMEVRRALEELGPGADPARVRVHGPRRHRPRRGVPAFARGTEFRRDVRGKRGGIFRGSAGRAAKRGAGGGWALDPWTAG